MRKTFIFFSTLFFPILIHAQIGPVNFIDTSIESAGVTKFESFDLNGDGLKDIFTSSTGNSGRLGYYQNLGDNTFSDFNLIEASPFCRGFAFGDFNNDNLMDIVSIGGINNDARIHLNNGGTFAESIELDSDFSTQLNDVVVADFDQNGSDDIVIIGQHSIDFYRNDGIGNFTKEVILTTSTSTTVLECLDLATKDMDGDGDMDLISGETAGLVIYTNDGNGVFSPHYYSEFIEVFFLVHPFDVDNDGDLDVVTRNGAGDVKWFSNNGSGEMTYEATLANVPNLISLTSIDYNNDGLEDIYASYNFHVSIFENDGGHTFSNETTVYQDDNLVMGPVQIADIDNQGGLDYVWSGGNNAVAFHLNQTAMAVNDLNSSPFSPFPNPTKGVVNFTRQISHITLYNAMGQEIMHNSQVTKINLDGYPSGVYILVLKDEGQQQYYQKIIKN